MLRKSKIIACLLVVCLTLFRQSIGLTNSFFSDTASISGNSVSAGDWTRPTSSITSEESSHNTLDFPIDYDSDDSGLGIAEVGLYFSFNGGPWEYFGHDHPLSPGQFNFNSPQGEGVYRFITVAIDNYGNVEDKNGNDVDDSSELDEVADFLYNEGLLYYVQVDITPPTTGLVLGEFGTNRWAGQNILKNGDFENPDYSPWVGAGSGDHTVVGPEFSRSGNNAFRIGFKDSDPVAGGQDYVYQAVSLPEKLSSSLSFWYRVLSDTTVDICQFNAEIRDENNFTLEKILSTGSDEIGGDSWSSDSGWREVTKSLIAYAGKLIKVWFGVANGDEADSGSRTWAHLDDLKITTTDNQLNTENPPDTDAHDTGSGVDETTITPTPVPVGESTVGYSSDDLADNQEATKTADVNVLANVVLNKFSAASSSGDEWAELYNNSNSAIDVDGWKICDSIDQCKNLTAANSQTGLTEIGSKSSLRFNDDFNLNNTGDKIVLKNNSDEKQDEFQYPDFDGDHDLIWQRNPDGLGSWKLVKPDWDYRLQYTNSGHKIWLVIYNLPADTQTLNYEIIYKSALIDKGIAGTISKETIDVDKTDRQFVLGTCSSGGVCVYDPIDANHFDVSVVVNTEGGGSESKAKGINL